MLARVEAVLREQFEHLMHEGMAAAPNPEDLARLAEVSAILMDPFRESTKPWARQCARTRGRRKAARG